jgi:mannose-6-phosphate isomerase-like protein (cupin superfamily)
LPLLRPVRQVAELGSLGRFTRMNVISTQNAEHYTWAERCDGWHLLCSEELNVIQERMPPKTSEVAHFHIRSRQFFYVLSGTLSILVGDRLHTVSAEHGLEVAPKMTHRVFNDGDLDVRFIVISSPPSHGDRADAAKPLSTP